MREDDRLSVAELAAWRGMLRAHSYLLRELDAEMTAGHGLSLRSYEVLVFLEDAPRHRLRMSKLSQSVLLSASGVSRLVNRLEHDGYVRRERCDLDGRGFYATLTAVGANKVQNARSTHLEGIRRRPGATRRLLGARAPGSRRRGRPRPQARDARLRAAEGRTRPAGFRFGPEARSRT